MLRFVFLAVLASVPASSLSTKLHGQHFSNLQDARLGDIEGLCKLFCEDHDYEEFLFQALEAVIQPRIFCGICKKKFSTAAPTTTTTTTTPTPTPTTPPPPPSSSTILSTTAAPSTSSVSTESTVTTPTESTPASL